METAPLQVSGGSTGTVSHLSAGLPTAPPAPKRARLPHKNSWRDPENDILREHYMRPYADLVEMLPGRTKRAIQLQINDALGLSRRVNGWTTAQDAWLAKYYATVNPKHAAAIIGRRWHTIEDRAHILGITRAAAARWRNEYCTRPPNP